MDEFEPSEEPQTISYMYNLTDEEFKDAQNTYFEQNKSTNYQIRINVFDTQETAYKITEAIEALNLGYNVRILNIDKGEDEIDDETQIFCKACGKLGNALHNYVCDACLILEKEERQKEHDLKHPITHGHVPYCTTVGPRQNYKTTNTGIAQTNHVQTTVV